jgi:hypothetical protein
MCYILQLLGLWDSKIELSYSNFTQNYGVFYGLCPSSGILYTTKHSVSEAGSVSVLRWGEGDTYSLGSFTKSWPQSLVQLLWLALSKGPSRVGDFLHSPEGRSRPSFRKIVFSSIQNPDDVQSPQTQWFYLLQFHSWDVPFYQYMTFVCIPTFTVIHKIIERCFLVDC